MSDIKLFVDRNATTSSKQYDVLIKAIQKHGGIIAETMEHVDFAILPATTQAQETSNVKVIAAIYIYIFESLRRLS